MSTQTFLRSSAIGAICIAGLSIAVSANAQGSRYGNVHAYESGSNCQVQPCATTHTQSSSSRYGSSYVEQAPAAPVYVDCQTTFGPQCGAPVVHQPTTVYTQPQAPVYSAPVQTYSEPTYQSQSTYTESYQVQAPANCPAGTTAQSDGTCLQGGGYTDYSVTLPSTHNQTYSDSYSSTTTMDTYSAPAPSYSAGPPANCPSGTTAQSDGTCMQTGSSYGSSTSYSSGSTYSGGSVELYTGDAQPTTTTVEPSYGYTSDGSYSMKDYRPGRK